MATRVELVNAIAENLGKLIPGEALGAEEAAAIDNRLPKLVEQANRRGFILIGDIEEFEDAIFDPFARWCAAKVCHLFGVPLNSIAGFEGEPMRSEAEMRALTRDSRANDVVKFVPF